MSSQADLHTISGPGGPLAYVVRSSFSPEKTTFVTPGTINQQLGFIVYPSGSEIPRHRHLPVTRSIEGTTEVIMVKSGRCIADVFDREGGYVESTELEVGDVIVFVAGGHGFRILEDTVLMEVKQGPYVAVADKERF